MNTNNLVILLYPKVTNIRLFFAHFYAANLQFLLADFLDFSLFTQKPPNHPDFYISRLVRKC